MVTVATNVVVATDFLVVAVVATDVVAVDVVDILPLRSPRASP